MDERGVLRTVQEQPPVIRPRRLYPHPLHGRLIRVLVVIRAKNARRRARLPIARYRASSSFLDDAATVYPEIVVKDEQELQIWRVVAYVVHTTREKTLSASVVRRTTLHAKRLALPEVLAYAGIDENWPAR